MDDEEEEEELLSDARLRSAPSDSSKRRFWLLVALAWAASIACTPLVVDHLFKSPAGREPAANPERSAQPETAAAEALGPPADLQYARWPPPQTALALATMAALGLGGDEPAALDAQAVAERMVVLGAERARLGQSPPILVIAGGNSALGLGNIFSGLTAAAVLADAIGGACVVSLGDMYARKLRAHLGPSRAFASPCVVVSLKELLALRAQTSVPVVKLSRWRVVGLWNATGNGGRAAGGAYVLDFGIKYRELVCLPRIDTAKLLSPPGMHPSAFWARLRSKFEEWVHVALQMPIEPHETRIDATTPPWYPRSGTLCGHMRLLHTESRRGAHKKGPLPCAKLDCGGLLSALEAVHSARPFSSFFVATGGNCSHCLPLVAPRLHREATRIDSRHLSRHVFEEVGFDDAEGAISDMRALSRCALVLADDKAEGTYALSFAAAGRLTPCADPLSWLEEWQPGFGSLFPHIRGTLDLQAPDKPYRARSLCSTDDPGAPVTPPPWPLSAADLERLRGFVDYDLAQPWDPRLRPPRGKALAKGGVPYVPDGCEGKL